MEQRRISERNNLYDKILQQKSAIQKERRSIELLRTNNTLSHEFINSKIQKSNDIILKYQSNIEMYENKREDIKKGYCDEEISKTYKQSFKKPPPPPPVKKKAPMVWHPPSHNSDRKISKDEIRRAYKYFTSVSESLPDYLSKKLKQMPNNKGYIWRGIYFYGEKPCEKNRPMTMFEKHKGVLMIHEWHANKYQLWKKEGDSKKVLVEEYARTHKN